jgi:hypothetical protein
MKSKDHGSYVEYGDIQIPNDLDSLKLVAAKQPEHAHITVVTARLYYILATKAQAYDAIIAQVREEKKNGTQSGEQPAASEEAAS